MDNKIVNMIISIIILLTIVLILLYLLIQNFGYIENQGPQVPTGNVDIFEIDCSCCDSVEKRQDDKPSSNEVRKSKKDFKEVIDSDTKIIDDKIEESTDNITEEDIPPRPIDMEVLDDQKMWDNKELRIFTNPAYEYKNVIAPGSYNSYTFLITNNNDFDITVDIIFEEINYNGINMLYKLRNNGSYLLGSEKQYETIRNKTIKNIKLSAEEQKSYILDWKWVDSKNDAKAGFDINSFYKLSIRIGAY